MMSEADLHTIFRINRSQMMLTSAYSSRSQIQRANTVQKLSEDILLLTISIAGQEIGRCEVFEGSALMRPRDGEVFHRFPADYGKHILHPTRLNAETSSR